MPYNGYAAQDEGDREDERYREELEQAFWTAQHTELVAYFCQRVQVRMHNRYPTTYRTKFIPEIKDLIGANLAKQGVSPAEVTRALRLWEEGKAPDTPAMGGCFEVFDTIQKQMDAGGR